ncbi:hypothetical protein [Mesorhizobium xinjiangense]|uniref:hypothetical protein n=1 Tax=Mesorhizobium xinjiangense TaxID=2678685 RepID=UPI0012EDCA1D|nr:hypothetical protein [Mesorhizobium xinjiangense]
MNLVELVMTVCLAASPEECRVERHSFESTGESAGSLMQCMFLAPSYIARWSQQHPAHRVVRWRCAFPDVGEDI